MAFSGDTTAALISAVDLVNTDGEPDTLTTTDQLAKFYVEHGYMGRFDGDVAELIAVRKIRTLLRRMLLSERDTAVGIVNEMLIDAPLRPQLVRHGNMDWHLHAIDDEQSFADRIKIETAMAVIDVIRADEMSRLHTCGVADCGGIVFDLSRNRSRRFCSSACGNRVAVAAYRTRKAGARR